MSGLLKEIKELGITENEEFTGEILWWFDKKGHGVISVTPENHEVYIDSSVTSEVTFKRGQFVTFNFNLSIKDCICGKNVKILK